MPSIFRKVSTFGKRKSKALDESKLKSVPESSNRNSSTPKEARTAPEEESVQQQPSIAPKDATTTEQPTLLSSNAVLTPDVQSTPVTKEQPSTPQEPSSPAPEPAQQPSDHGEKTSVPVQQTPQAKDQSATANVADSFKPNDTLTATVGDSDTQAPQKNTIGESLDQSRTAPIRRSTYAPGVHVDNAPPKPVDDAPPPDRREVEGAFDQFSQLIHAAIRPMPSQTGDGSYVQREESSGIWADIKNLGFKDLNTVRRIMEQKASGEPQDDRKYLMESVMQLTASLPTRSKNRAELTGMFLDELYNSLDHPPMSYLGDDFKYRSADGSRNSYIFPMLGAANTPYARSVNPQTVQPGNYPDPFLLYDSLLAREKFIPNPNRVSSLFFHWASIVIHDLFQTDHRDQTNSKTSSYLDLSTLYGDCQEDQDSMRTFKDGRLKPDCFAEERLLAFPPASGVLLILLNRFHNHVVEQLALVNEGGRFNKPSDHLPEEMRAQAWKKYDNDLFQTGRLVTCGLYINVTLYDYLRTIVNLNRTNSTWTLDPRMEKGAERTPRGAGNQVSAEFSLCYRWHSCIGEDDERWTDDVYNELFGKPAGDVDMRELMIGLKKFDEELPEDPLDRPFAKMKRDASGKYADEDLASLLITSIEQVSGAFGARNVPKNLRSIVAMGINQARGWNLCTLNEFRKYFGLKQFDTFEEINSDPYVAEQLKNLYEHPDFVEFFPGIFVEEAKTPMIPGVGICPNHTVARAILSDAVALVRGDRFYTLDYSPKNLTSWGYNEVQYDLNINQGCVIYKLLINALPNHFKPDSIYAHYPMTVPDENEKIMKDLGRFHDYSWDRPKYKNPPVEVTSYESAKYMLERSQDFKVTWNEGLGFVLGAGGERFCLAGDTVFHKQQRELMMKMIYKEKWQERIKSFYEYTTLRLLHEKSVRIAGINQVDITRDVGNLAHVHFSANMFDLPLKTAENPKGLFTEHELWMAMSVMFTSVFYDLDPTKSFGLRAVSKKLATMLGKLVEVNINTVTATGFAARFFDSKREHHNALADYGIHMVRELANTGMSTYDIAFSQILPTAIAMVPNQSQAFTQVVDYYLGPGKDHWPAIQELSRNGGVDADEKLLHYVQEGIRLNGTIGNFRRAEVTHTFHEDGKDIHVKPGDKVFCNLVHAARDPKIFPNPDKVDITRPLSSYLHYGTGDHTCLGKDASNTALTAMLKVLGRLENLRRAPGGQGQLKKIPRPGGFNIYMREDHGSFFVFPTTMKLHYDGVLPAVPQVIGEEVQQHHHHH